MGSCEELEISLGKSLEKSLENPRSSSYASSDKHAERDNESRKDKREQRIKKLRATEKSDTNIRSYNVRDFSEPPSADSGNRNYDGGCSTDESGMKPTDVEKEEGCMDVKKDRSRGVVSDKSPKVETRNLKRARSQQQDHTSKKHWSHRKESRNTEESKNEHRSEQREVDDEKKRRRGDADELDSNREESTNGRKRTKREDKAEVPPDTDNITQIMKFIRRMALLSDERLMQNLQHGFPLHAQDTILAGFRIIEWFQGTESDLEDL
ncbi:hypothetical protein K456DRAFT_28611 [Colletotrichum gloeosporioides 23]|nr:hypothetical protein K456DRAFT_28611 [Colletotrichum gloeosporioides 23]KAJ0270361.1 hypothetical protein COL940_011716 [Colletotrichum noveboracense]KAJ0284446.1 hypothetical protein CBS470a_006828 [Colletotrichum nupharicola]KAJ0312643.1 hypothetical protein Brms1b_007851 [Colletotrichum noveboracense]